MAARAPRVLVLFAHPALERSRINRYLVQAPEELDGVSLRDLYELYPDFEIDVGAEQEALQEHDVVVFQHPLYWYSAPPLLKQWQDLVLEHGWAYGGGGRALTGKTALHVITAGGGEEAYAPGAPNRYPLGEYLRPFEGTALLCGMRFLPPFVVYRTHELSQTQLQQHVAAYRRLLTALRDDELDIERALGAGDLRDALSMLARTPVPDNEL